MFGLIEAPRLTAVTQRSWLVTLLSAPSASHGWRYDFGTGFLVDSPVLIGVVAQKLSAYFSWLERSLAISLSSAGWLVAASALQRFPSPKAFFNSIGPVFHCCQRSSVSSATGNALGEKRWIVKPAEGDSACQSLSYPRAVRKTAAMLERRNSCTPDCTSEPREGPTTQAVPAGVGNPGQPVLRQGRRRQIARHDTVDVQDGAHHAFHFRHA